MNHTQIQQEIAIIKAMIEKTKRETAESGLFLILIGVVGVIGTLAIGILELRQLNYLDLPILILITLVNGLLGYLLVTRAERREKVKSYAKTILYRVWSSCAIPALLIVFLFPLTKVYPFRLVPTLVSVIMGIIVFTGGVIYELRYVQWCSVIWWLGAILMAYIESQYRFLIMVGMILFGFILPGILFNQPYKNRSRENAS